MTIDVTQEDIDHGIRLSCQFCPVALAIRRAVGHARVTVDGVVVRVCGAVYDLPAEVADFVDRFDMGGKVEPFSFELDIRV